MNALTKLSIAAGCLYVANKLDNIQQGKEQAARFEASRSESDSIAKDAEDLSSVAVHLQQKYNLRDAQKQEVEKAIRLINDIKLFSTASIQRQHLSDAREKLGRVYNAVK